MDDPVESVLPEVGNARLLNGDKPKTKITLRHLLTHTAGFDYTFFNHDIKKWGEEKNIDEFGGTIEGVTQPLTFEPGTKWAYGVNIDWAGEYLARVTGMKLSECEPY